MGGLELSHICKFAMLGVREVILALFFRELILRQSTDIHENQGIGCGGDLGS